MPELPDITVYQRALRRLLTGQSPAAVRVRGVSLLRSVNPPVEAVEGRVLRAVGRLGTRLVLSFEGDLHLVLHLMLAGRLRWRPAGAASPPGNVQASLQFPAGTLFLTEAGSMKRATMHLVAGEAARRAHDPGGAEIDDLDSDAFIARLTAENRTLKRRLTDPRVFSGIGNAYSDEILHAARLSPLRLTQALTREESVGLFEAARATLAEWTERLWEQTQRTKYAFPE
ncbi:MAG: DNA-formamidopyrimidine glycosylase family protein [Phycisphaerales bacterium JB037]